MSKRRKNRSPDTRMPKRQKSREVYVPRPFQGLASEGDWVALRELVPAATAPLRLADEFTKRFGERTVTLATVLPMAWPALAKPDGQVLVGLQRHAQSGDASRDIAAAILGALEAQPGEPVTVPALPGEGPRLQELLAGGGLDVTVHSGFEFWLDPTGLEDPEIKASLERANASIYPTTKLTAAPAAYWSRVPDKAHVRWVLTEDEEPALAALARLAAAGALTLGTGTRFAGMFRAHGLLIPVWDVPGEADAAKWDSPLANFAARYAEALVADGELSLAERRSREGLLGRQLTLR